MQLTRFDRWLREKFVYETHVYTLRPPAKVPAGVIAQTLPETPGRQYRHRYIVRSARKLALLLGTLKDDSQMFTTRIVDRRAWYVPLIAPRRGSIVWWLVWAALLVVSLVCFAQWLLHQWQNPEMQKNLKEALEILKG